MSSSKALNFSDIRYNTWINTLRIWTKKSFRPPRVGDEYSWHSGLKHVDITSYEVILKHALNLLATFWLIVMVSTPNVFSYFGLVKELI